MNDSDRLDRIIVLLADILAELKGPVDLSGMLQQMETAMADPRRTLEREAARRAALRTLLEMEREQDGDVQ